MSKPKILLIAEACNPETTSVPLVGWSLYKALSKICDVHLVTQIRNKKPILKKSLKEKKDVTFIDSEKVARRLWKLASFIRGDTRKAWTVGTAFSSISYYYFEYLLWKKFKKKIKSGEFDIVHRITPLTPTAQSIIAKKCKKAGIPFILGPLNGGLPWPKGFNDRRHKEKEWLSYFRNLYKLMPYYRSTRKYASKIIIGSKATWNQMPKKYHKKCIYIPENAIDPKRFKFKRTKKSKKPIKVIFIGRLVPYKGADMLLEAAAPLVKDNMIKLEYFGDGPEMDNLKKIAEKHKIKDKIKLHGWVNHKKLQKKIISADVFGFPSIREFGGGVVLEAMASGLVPIVVDYGGPGELVTEETGYLIKINKKEKIIKDFRNILKYLAENPQEINKKRKSAIKRARTLFTWEAKAKQVKKVYKKIFEKLI